MRVRDGESYDKCFMVEVEVEVEERFHRMKLSEGLLMLIGCLKDC